MGLMWIAFFVDFVGLKEEKLSFVGKKVLIDF